MAIGAARSLSAELDRSAPSSGTATTVARCEAGVERWTLAIQVDVYRVDPAQFIWGPLGEWEAVPAVAAAGGASCKPGLDSGDRAMDTRNPLLANRVDQGGWVD
jgi:hypothetical protein